MAVEWLAADLKAESDAMLEEDVKLWLEKAKAHGLDVIEYDFMKINGAKQFGYVNEYGNSHSTRTSQEGLNDLLQGKIKKISDIPDGDDYYLLIREVQNPHRDNFIYIVESIIIND